MPRNKYPEVTRARILEAATKLFLEKGWQETTVQDIIDELGDMTRGAFYHHFRSKDDIIDAVVDEVTATNFIALARKAARLQCTALEKLRYLTAAGFSTNEKTMEPLKSIPSVFQSPIYIGKVAQDAMNFIAPHIIEILEEGNRDGSLCVRYPKQAAETFLLLSELWTNPFIFPTPKEEYLRRIEHLRVLLDGIGIPLIDDALYEKIKNLADIAWQ
jgi:AcrR family transcriptional regulator